MIDTAKLFTSVLLLFILIIPGFLLRKAKLASDYLPKGFTNVILYVTQPALIMVSFIRPYDSDVMKSALGVLVFTFILHGVFFLISLAFFNKCEEKLKRVYRFGCIFSNAGYMGIPLIMALLGADAAIYASVYIIGFNFYCWSVGCMIYSGDKSFISPKKMFINPATIPTYIGLIFFLLPIDSFVPTVVVDALETLRGTVAPMSMMLVGMQLADMKLKGAFKDINFFVSLFLKLLLFPAIAWLFLKAAALCGIYSDDICSIVVLVCAATPSAAATSMFAEKFDGDSVTAGKFVSISTVLSLVTIPLVSLLLKI